jgi:hypothetical protein
MKHNGQPIMDDEDAFGEDSRRINLHHADAGEGITRLAARYNWSTATAMAIITDVLDEFGGAGAGHGKSIVEYHGLIERGFTLREQYVKQHGDAVMSERCLWLLLRFPTLAGAATLDELVKAIGRQKATVNKCLKFFQNKMPELPIVPGQRTEVARQNMAAAQKHIWHGKPGATKRR